MRHAFCAMLSFGIMTSAATAPVPASAAPVYYLAIMANPATDARMVVRDTLWTCADTTCTASEAASRPANMCATLTRKAGPVVSFIAGTERFDAERLAACNLKAK